MLSVVIKNLSSEVFAHAQVQVYFIANILGFIMNESLTLKKETGLFLLYSCTEVGCVKTIGNQTLK